MTIAGAVVTYYFTKNKSQLPVTPILSSMARTIRYHLGTLAKGSFIITLVKIPRLILTYIHSQLKGKENACARCMLKACVCCLWCLEKCLAYLNQNALHRRQPSTAPASAPPPATLSSSWWRTPSEWPPSTPWATLSSSWERCS
ncbi:Choline transporter-like protein 1 [Larimichthys crocea]|uniref:Uncharacterized protein n=1 Tax=Larimichthys crocea TaxID=215358 RepID=A0ACD3RUI6_LARCR|nr:Choline transporter-like protein 1 [Larimichthys crocea]